MASSERELLESAHSILASLAAGSFVKDASPEDFQKGILELMKRAIEWTKEYQIQRDYEADMASAAVQLGEDNTGFWSGAE
jgi:hypothetical protein